jgi:hypothetical protein
MKRLFWSFLGAFIGSLVVWVFARRQMDSLYAEISRLRLLEHKQEELNAYYAKKNAEDRKEEAERLATMSPEERIDYEMRQAEINSYIKSQIGEEVYNELTARERNSKDF